MYNESVAGFNDIIDKVNAQISTLTDRTLVAEWNRFRDDLKRQRDMALSMKQLL
jgi:hypothetical protein